MASQSMVGPEYAPTSTSEKANPVPIAQREVPTPAPWLASFLPCGNTTPPTRPPSVWELSQAVIPWDFGIELSQVSA